MKGSQDGVNADRAAVMAKLSRKTEETAALRR
jgi:hypothetical protein